MSAPLGPEALAWVRELAHREASIAIGADMDYLVGVRLAELGARTGGISAGALVRRMRDGGDEDLRAAAIEALTVNETSFLRDGAPLESLCGHVLPALAARRAGPLIVWCAACSTGQEPWSIAMLVHERLPELAPRVRILATDIDRRCVARAREGVYTRFETERGLSPAMRERHLVPVGDAWRIGPHLRERVDFERLNIAGPWTGVGRVHAVVMRNVLIYFDPVARRRALERVRGVLAPGGRLLLGHGETAVGLVPGCTRERLGDTWWFGFDEESDER